MKPPQTLFIQSQPWVLIGLLAIGMAPASAMVDERPKADTRLVVEAQQDPRFDIYNFHIEGNSVLDVESVEMAVYPFLGPQKKIEDVEQARKALEAIYRERGYPTVVVDIPEQNVEEGVVNLRVVEGEVEYLKISGTRYFSQGLIRNSIPSLAQGQVPYMPEVKKELGAVSAETQDRSVTPIFRAGTTPGKTEVEIKVKDSLPVHGGLEINGRNTEYTTRPRLVASIRYDNLWEKFHSAALQYQVSPENADQVQVWTGTYVMPTGLDNTKLALYGVGINSNTDLGATVGGSTVVGTGNIFGARFIKPLEPISAYSHSLIVGLDYKNFDQAVTLVGQDTGKTPIHYVPLTIGYDGLIRGADFTTTLTTMLHYGIQGLGSGTQAFEDKRAGARPNFLYFSGELRHQHEMLLDTLAVLRVGGQISDQPLISNEQYAVGGMQSVRGYYQTQQLGDDGVNLSIELHSPRLVPLEWEAFNNIRALTFFDWGYLWIKEPLPLNPSWYHLAATGVGLRAQVMRYLVGELDWGYPFNRQGTVGVGSQRIDFRMAYEF